MKRPTMRPTTRRTATLVAAGALAAAGTAVPAYAHTGGPPPAARGALLADRPLTGAAALPSAAVNRLVTYVSAGVRGGRAAVSGTVSLPRTPPPRGGWPVISWAHGTTGTADPCAPSADAPRGPAHDYLSGTSRYLDRWVARGYAVVQTDYEGLGTPGGHPYMNGRSEADNVLDMVRAARRVDRRVGRDWFAAGHSQGGHAALFTAAARSGARDLNLKGAVALAPGSVISQTPAYVQSGQPGAQAAMPFLFVMLNGARAADPSLRTDRLLTPRAAEVARAGRTGACLAQLGELGADLPPDQVFRPGADLKPLTDYLRSQEPFGLRPTVPILIAQGSADTAVTPAASRALAADLCSRYTGVTYRAFEGADHRAVIGASFDEALGFVEAVRAGRPPAGTC
ncbi:alpha/beta hydrolase family protein [Spirillospora sp. NPDC050679]